MEAIIEKILKSRAIKQNSAMIYASAIGKIHKTMFGIKEYTTFDFLSKYDDVIEAINKEKSLTSKKNKLTAILVALKTYEKLDLPLIKKYNDVLTEYNHEYMEFLKKQEKTETQKANWLEYEQLIELSNKLSTYLKKSILKTDDPDYKIPINDFEKLQQYVMLRTYLLFPIRNDFANMQVLNQKDYDELPEETRKSNNYLVEHQNKSTSSPDRFFHINDYKNSKFLGPKVFKIPKPLNKVIDFWFKHNKSGYYLVKGNRKTPMTEYDITSNFNKLFLENYGKKISTSMIRHIIISHITKGDKTIAQKESDRKAIEDKFMHSDALNDLYRKVD